ncbi:hypothetical protein D3C71_1802250 [compost metagenome]
MKRQEHRRALGYARRRLNVVVFEHLVELRRVIVDSIEADPTGLKQVAQRACSPEWMSFSADDQTGHPAQRFPIQVEPLRVLLRSDGEIQRAVAYLLDDLVGA